MTTKKTPTSPSPQTNHTNTNHPRKPTGAYSKPATSQTKTQREQQKPAPSTAPQTRATQRESTPKPKPRINRRRRPTLRQRIARLSGGSWLAIITGVLVIGIVVFAIIASRANPTSGPSSSSGMLTAGTTAPAIATLPAADGKSYNLAQYKGKVVVLEFFAPWCPHCQAETGTLKQIQANDASKGVQVLSVSASPYGRNYEASGGTDTTPISMSDIQWFSSNFGLNYPALFDPSLKAANDYGVTAYPTIYVINKQGVITNAENGEISYASLQQQITAALNQ